MGTLDSSAQELGKPFIRNYSPKEYNAGSIMFDIIQDQQGIMYFANSWNIKVFDGVNWDYIPLSNQRDARSLTMDADGRIYVGGVDDLGYLQPDKQGKMEFVSLISKLPEALQKCGSVGQAIYNNGNVYFVASKLIARWNGKEMKIWTLPTSSLGTFIYKETVYVNLKNTGLHILKEELLPIEGGEQLGEQIIINGFEHEGSLVIATQLNALIKVNFLTEQKIEAIPYPTVLDDFFKENQIWSTKQLSGMWVIGTAKAGAAITDLDFNLLCFIDKSTDLQSDAVINSFADKDGIIWMALNGGVSKVEITTPINKWDAESGLNGTVISIRRHNGILIVSTNKGLFYLKNLGKGHSQFFRVGNTQENIYYSSTHFQPNLQKSKKMLVCAYDGIMEVYIENGEAKIKKVLDHATGFARLRTSPKFPNRIYLMSRQEIKAIEYINGKWIDKGKIEGIDDIRKDNIEEDFDGRIWLITLGGKVRRFEVTEKNGKLTASNIETFGKENNLPATQFTTFQRLSEDMIFTSEVGIYLFNDEQKKFQIAKKFGPQLADYYTGFYFFEEDQEHNLWYYAYQQGENIWHEVSYKQPDGNYVTDSVSLRRIPTVDSGFEGTYADPENGAVWFGGTFGLYRYDNNLRWLGNKDFNAFIRRVVAGEDSVVFFGTNYIQQDGETLSALEQNPEFTVNLPYNLNSLQFQFASNNFYEEDQNEYSYLLEKEGDKASIFWSNWSKESNQHIRNLREGNYILRVKVRNVYGIVSQEAQFQFKLQPPWFRTTWAYIGYGMSSILLIILIVWLNSIRLIKQKEKLEQTVKERTEEVVAQSENLRQANEEITSKNEALAEQQEEILAKNEEINTQNITLENTNKHITDSINYASRIQKAILGQESEVVRQFKDAFVILQPKDIVSGDFYWYGECKHPESKQRRKVLIAADCTGHGVPGAFMTVMGSSLLNEIVNNEDVLEPNEILSKLDQKVVAATNRQSAVGQVNDGMDMQVLLVDNWNAKLLFSGAKNPLYRIRKGEIEMFRGSKYPIGSTQFKGGKDFELIELDMLPGDKYYIASDGFQDQFGGEFGRKFLRKQFRELLLDSSQFDMAIQKQKLENTLLNWKGTEKQTDDILVIGFEV